jgi:hypothetical protein
MAVTISFNFPDYTEAADFLARLNGEDWPATVAASDHPSRPTASADDDTPPWETPESDAKASADPWADEPTPAKPDTSAADSAIGVLFPAKGTYQRETPNGNRTWQFGVPDAPTCDCGYPSALVSGRKAGAKKDWHAYWCPVGFNKEKYRDKCTFSEFAH